MVEAGRSLSRAELWVNSVLRVPPYPQPPDGSPESIQVFRAGKSYYIWCLLVWFISHFVILIALVAIAILALRFMPRMPAWGQRAWWAVEIVAALVFVGVAVFSFFSQRMNYALRWYIVTDRSLRIRTGVLRMQELTMTFSNIQEIRVSAGPIQNLLKIADVEVQSAGGGSAKDGGGHIGRFEGVSNANAIRDLMVERLRRYRDSGLGDAPPAFQPSSVEVLDAARLVLEEVKALRGLQKA